MPTTRGAAKDPKDTQDGSGGASESNIFADAEIDGPYDDGHGNFEGHSDDGDDGTMVAVTTMDDSLAKTMDDSLAKMTAMQARIDLMQASQAQRNDEMLEKQEKTTPPRTRLFTDTLYRRLERKQGRGSSPFPPSMRRPRPLAYAHACRPPVP